MSINFLPGNFLGETLTEGGKTWTWDGQKWNLSGSSVNGNFVLRTGDVMTGDLVMDGADIELDNGNIEFEAKGNLAYVQDPNNRFAKIVSRAPKDITDNDNADYDGGAFGIKVELNEGNTHKNRFIVGNQHGDIVSISSGGGPNVQLGDNFPGNEDGWDDEKYEGSVSIKGIPTPAFDNPEPTIAVNKEYVDNRDEILQQEIIELEEEIDAIAPSTQRGEWHFDRTNTPPDPGDYYLLKGASGLNPEATELYNEADGVVFHNVDAHGVINTWSNVVAGELIQIFDKPDPDFILGTITNVDTTKISNAVWIEFDRISAEGSPNNNPDIKLSRLNIFEAPSGGDASEFVKKIGDTMTGPGALKFANNQDTAGYDSNSAKAKITFENKTSDGTTKTSHIFQAGDNNMLVTNAYLMSKQSVYTGNYFYGWDGGSGSSAITYSPRIQLTSSAGHLKYGSSGKILSWGSSGTEFPKKLTIDVPQPSSNSNSFILMGRRKHTTTGVLEHSPLLKDFRRNSTSTSSDYVAYYGDSGGDYEIANKKYVDARTLPSGGAKGQVVKKSRDDNKPAWQGAVDIDTSGSNRAIGEMWYNNNDGVLYLRIS
jgi:hypothetical protein